jgi:alpha-glucosidase
MKKIALSLTLITIFSCSNNLLNENDLQQSNFIDSGVKVYATSKKSGSIKGDGIYSDQTELYMSNPEPGPNENIQIKLRAYKDNLTNAYIVFNDGNIVEMKKTSQDSLSLFDFWTANINTGSKNLRYKFKLQNGNDIGWYNVVGFYDREPNNEFSFWITPYFKTPDWAKDSIYYQIFVDRFYNGNTKNDVKNGEYVFPYPQEPNHPNNVKVIAKKWNELPEQPAKNRDFFGGDIEGVRQKLSYLKSLGVNTIYFNPIFHSPSNHKYDTQDYRTIDPHFGTNEEFKKFVQEAHSKGIKIILDGVFNHTGSWHRWFDRANQYPDTLGAFESKDSPWSDFYNFNKWPDNYISWWGFDTLPKLNYASKKLRDEIYNNSDSIAKHWIKNYGIDGWRLDVPNEAGPNGQSNDHSIWREFRQAVKSTNPNVLIIGELWKDAQPWLQGDQFDGVMNYEGFADPVSTYINHGYTIETTKREKIRTTDFVLWLRSMLAKQPHQANLVMMNLLGSHDTSRFMYRAEGDEWKMYEAAIFQMTYVGGPMIYYGDEIGLTGAKDPDCRRTFNWNYSKSLHLPKLYTKLGQIRNNNSALRRGTFETLLIDDQNEIFAYGRMDKKNKVVVILNNTSSTKNVKLDVSKMGWGPGTILKDELNNTSLSPRTITVQNDMTITLPLFGHYGAILTPVKESVKK